MEVLRSRDGHEVRFLAGTADADVLQMEHRWPSPGRMAGIPPRAQRLVLGALASLARRRGHAPGYGTGRAHTGRPGS